MTKRIALVGNMNNNFFAITRYLRDMGYDAHLFYRLGMEHFQPKADTYLLSYQDYCHEVSWLDRGFHNIAKEEVRTALKDFDFYIGQGDEAAAAYYAGFRMDVYYPYGSDVYKYAYLPREYSIANKAFALLGQNNAISYKQMQIGMPAKYLHGVITTAGHLLAEYTNEDFENKLQGLNCAGRYDHVPMPFIYCKEYEQIACNGTANVHWKSEADSIRQEYDFVFLYHGRHEWKTVHNDFTGKNTNHMVEAFADSIKANPGKKFVLVLVEYGTDVRHTKTLIAQLGISAHVKWFPKMYRKDLMYVISNADACFGEFGRSYLTYGTIVEAMLMKKPVIHRRNDELYTGIYNELYPMFNASSVPEIVAAMQQIIDEPEKAAAVGERAQEWIKTNFISKPLAHLDNIIRAKFL